MKTVISSIPYFKFLSLHDSSYHSVSAVSFSNEIPMRIFCLANCACEQLTVSGVPGRREATAALRNKVPNCKTRESSPLHQTVHDVGEKCGFGLVYRREVTPCVMRTGR